jgi:uncharacterized protein (TIGR03067 family)
MLQDIDLLQGSWSVKSLSMEGHEMPPALFAAARIVIQGIRFTSLGMGAQYEGTLELDASATPRHLNMNFDAGPEKGNVNLCIYEIAGDTWKLCIATRGSVRPSAFISIPGTGVALQLLQRSKSSQQ